MLPTSSCHATKQLRSPGSPSQLVRAPTTQCSGSCAPPGSSQEAHNSQQHCHHPRPLSPLHAALWSKPSVTATPIHTLPTFTTPDQLFRPYHESSLLHHHHCPASLQSALLQIRCPPHPPHSRPTKAARHQPVTGNTNSLGSRHGAGCVCQRHVQG